MASTTRSGGAAVTRAENLELWHRSGQPAGQRVPDLLGYIATHYRRAIREVLEHTPEPNASEAFLADRQRSV
jgi:hypothetical protein